LFVTSGTIDEVTRVLIDVRVLVGVVFLAKILVCLLDLAVGGTLLKPEEL
jgi:hypothetical protein